MKVPLVVAALFLALCLSTVAHAQEAGAPAGSAGLTGLAWGSAGAGPPPPAWERWVLPPLAGLAGGLAANTLMLVVADTLSAVLVYPLFYLPARIDFATGMTLTSHYTLLASAALLAPLFSSIGVLGYGESIGRKGTVLSVLLSYAGAAAGAALYLAGYPQAGTYVLLTAPAVGAVAGFWIRNRPLQRAERPFAPTPFWVAVRRIGGGVLGGLIGELLYLSARFQVPLLESDRASFGALVAGTFTGAPLDWIAAIPLACSTGVVLADRFQRHSGSLLLTLGAGLAGSLAGWGVSALAGTDSTIPALLLCLLSSVTVSLIGEPRGAEAAQEEAARPALQLTLLPARAPAVGLRVAW